MTSKEKAIEATRYIMRKVDACGSQGSALIPDLARFFAECYRTSAVLVNSRNCRSYSEFKEFTHYYAALRTISEGSIEEIGAINLFYQYGCTDYSEEWYVSQLNTALNIVWNGLRAYALTLI